MRKFSRDLSSLVIAVLLTCQLPGAFAASTSGLWVGEVTLQRVNETVSGFNAANQLVSPNPAVATPVNSPAHLRIILHVDASGQVRLLKGVAIINKSTNSTPDIVLISDPTQYQRYGNSIGQRITAVAFDFGDTNGVPLNEVLMTGQIAPTNTLTGSIYLGADHPTNPFRHKWNPIHRHGYAVTRALTVNFDSLTSSNAVALAGFGVDRITGSYREEISGLHKPLGPDQNIGLITEGVIKLERVSLVDALNQ